MATGAAGVGSAGAGAPLVALPPPGAGVVSGTAAPLSTQPPMLGAAEGTVATAAAAMAALTTVPAPPVPREAERKPPTPPGRYRARTPAAAASRPPLGSESASTGDAPPEPALVGDEKKPLILHSVVPRGATAAAHSDDSSVVSASLRSAPPTYRVGKGLAWVFLVLALALIAVCVACLQKNLDWLGKKDNITSFFIAGGIVTLTSGVTLLYLYSRPKGAALLPTDTRLAPHTVVSDSPKMRGDGDDGKRGGAPVTRDSALSTAGRGTSAHGATTA